MLTTEQILLCSQVKGIGYVSLKALIDYVQFNNLEINCDSYSLVDLFTKINLTNKRIKIPKEEDIELAIIKKDKIIYESDKNNINILSISDECYPKILKDIPNKLPLLLHYKGNLACLEKPCIAIIGTREPSKYGIRAGVALSKKLAEDDVCIVSGLAIGCDTIGHESALDAGIPTVAVMAGGLHSIYPQENKKLAQKIIDNNGLLISELPYGVAPTKSTFISRNRIQSGLSEGVFIIETDVKGGTLHTVEFASIQDREIGVLFSHPINNEGDNPKFQGNKLINEKYKSIAMNSPETIDLFMTKISDKFKTRGIIKNNFNIQTRLDF
jgi:DNA processing protein